MIARNRSTAADLEGLLDKGQFAAALRYYLDHPDELTDPRSRYLAGTAAARVGEYRMARSLATAALEGFTGANDRRGRMIASNLRGGIDVELGRLADAERSFQDAVALAVELGDDAQQAKLWNNLGLVAHASGDDRKAIELYAKALGIYRRSADLRGMAQTCHNMAIRFRAAGSLPQAIAYADQAVDHARGSGDPALFALVTMGRAEIEIELARWDDAQQDVARSIDLAASARDHLGVAEGMRLQALIALGRGQLDVAEREAAAAYTQAVDLGAELTAAECGAVWSVALKRLSRSSDAESRYRETTRGFQRIGAIEPLERFLTTWAAA